MLASCCEVPVDIQWCIVRYAMGHRHKEVLKRHIFPLFGPCPLTFDLDLQKIGLADTEPALMPKIRPIGPTVRAGEAVKAEHTVVYN